jgi:RimJ/RimL family protein N-acetyltransferase
MRRPSPELRTERLILRQPILADAEAIFAEYAADPQVTRYLLWPPHKSVEDTREVLRGCIGAWSDLSGRYAYVITLAQTTRPVGMIETRLANFKAQIGYVLARRLWAQGYMTEAVGAVVRQALALPGVLSAWAVCDVDNVASARVLEKAGMSLQTRLERFVVHPNVGDQPRDVLCYSMSR